MERTWGGHREEEEGGTREVGEMKHLFVSGDGLGTGGLSKKGDS